MQGSQSRTCRSRAVDLGSDVQHDYDYDDTNLLPDGREGCEGVGTDEGAVEEGDRKQQDGEGAS